MYPLPSPLLVKRESGAISARELLVPCPLFDNKRWRFDRLAAHLTDWLPEFSFRPDDLPDRIENTSEVRRLMERAIEHLYAERAGPSRGELGELLLHICCRQFFGTFPAVSKLFYKTSSNEVVKGFDLAHVRVSHDEKIEIWLGEAKFYQDGKRAAAAAIKSIQSHLDRGFLKSEKIMLGGKISPQTPGYEKLLWMFDVDTPLDEIFDRIVVPVIICYDSAPCASFENDKTYLDQLEKELFLIDDIIRGSSIEVCIVKIMLPMNSKKLLQDEFNRRLGFYRS
ncbi:DUF1837 domain-containing protein [Bosea sp. CCNWLW174]|uniref:HamA C-terminal domain-containing protein n=1 Tax=unclassified Bosea (in: a-proteobacteria) TaxID=2653178 RepID=UPI0030156A73